MATILSDRRYTPEDLLKMPDGKRFELVRGQLVEAQMGAFASWIILIIGGELSAFVRQHRLGMVMSSETQYQCFPDDPRRIRKPDVSFIHRSRLTPDLLHGFVRIAPDLAVEVVSENDLYYDVDTKVREYLQAGVRLIWILNPATSRIRIYRLAGTSDEIGTGEVLDGEDVLPGFSIAVDAIFQLPESDVELS